MEHAKHFLRWKERHVVHFTLAHSRGAGAPAGTPPSARLHFPPKFSRTIQESPCGTWHFPSAESEREWLCVRPAHTVI